MTIPTEDRGPCRRCGHPENLHTHHRAGDDCGTCGKTTCPAYRKPQRTWRSWFLGGAA